MKGVLIPQRVDEPPHCLLWSADELVSIVGALIIGVMCGQLLYFGLVGVVAAIGYRKFRDNSPDGFLLHLLWRSGCMLRNSRSMQNPYVSFFIAK